MLMSGYIESTLAKVLGSVFLLSGVYILKDNSIPVVSLSLLPRGTIIIIKELGQTKSGSYEISYAIDNDPEERDIQTNTISEEQYLALLKLKKKTSRVKLGKSRHLKSEEKSKGILAFSRRKYSKGA